MLIGAKISHQYQTGNITPHGYPKFEPKHSLGLKQ